MISVALVVKADAYHARALALMNRIFEERPQLVTTRPVLLEV